MLHACRHPAAPRLSAARTVPARAATCHAQAVPQPRARLHVQLRRRSGWAHTLSCSTYVSDIVLAVAQPALHGCQPGTCLGHVELGVAQEHEQEGVVIPACLSKHNQCLHVDARQEHEGSCRWESGLVGALVTKGGLAGTR